MSRLPNVLMVVSGEYTTGYVHGLASQSDKSAGVVALTLFDLRAAVKIGRLMMAGTNGTKFPGVRQHFQEKIAEPYGLDVAIETFPEDQVVSDASAFKHAMDQLEQDDIVIIFTPDDTHFEIAMEAVRRQCHVLIAKPIVKTLVQHHALAESSASSGSLVCMEVHKRWDPIYADACDRIRGLGDFSLFHAYMSQPKLQLDSFKSWAGKSSDISYYLNAHHLDFLSMAIADRSRPVLVTAMSSNGVAEKRGIETEDSITLLSKWENLKSRTYGTAVCTASWIAPQSDVHSQQRFFYQGHQGETGVDQAHRGYYLADDQGGFISPNPLFMKYTPDANGRFVGQQGYGYRSIADFVDAVLSMRSVKTKAEDWDHQLATVNDTFLVTAVLEAGRMSLNGNNAPVRVEYKQSGRPSALSYYSPK